MKYVEVECSTCGEKLDRIKGVLHPTCFLCKRQMRKDEWTRRKQKVTTTTNFGLLNEIKYSAENASKFIG